MTTATKTVREFVLENPAATRVLEEMGIDYCCGGNKPLDEACAAAGMSMDGVLARVQAESYAPDETSRKNWQGESLAGLIEHIVSTHHVYVRSECPRLAALLDKVCKAHGSKHPELHEIRRVFGELAAELASHLLKEERILFPYVTALEQEAGEGDAKPASCFGTVRNPIRMMMFEHDNAGAVLRELRTLSKNYEVPADACISYRTLYETLAAFEADLHQHIHLENNILFPGAIALEG